MNGVKPRKVATMSKRKPGKRQASNVGRKVPTFVPKRTRLYFGYGSNMHEGQMVARCPEAVPLGVATLNGWSLREHTYADIVPSPAGVVHGVVWHITADCEASLDVYEGVSSGHYNKRLVPLTFQGKQSTALVYVMAPDNAKPGPFSAAYAVDCALGAAQFGCPVSSLYLLRLRAALFDMSTADDTPARWYESEPVPADDGWRWDGDLEVWSPDVAVDGDDDGDGDGYGVRLGAAPCEGCGNPADDCDCERVWGGF